MRQILNAFISDQAVGAQIASELILGVTIDEVDEAAALWSPVLRQWEQTSGGRVEHGHWDWSRKARAISLSRDYYIAGVRTQGEMQALMLWDEDFHYGTHPLQLGSPLVYVHFLATAPWNDREIVAVPRYKGTGTQLLRTAVERSDDLGYKRRLGLHSLPQAEGFYRDRCLMADLGIDATKKLRYFEFTSELAQNFIDRIGGTR
jgi:GNAT superfamily N-acetyltransferase